jgi:Arc/MetJ-type ribon-helix-helix transcriptional regulator
MTIELPTSLEDLVRRKVEAGEYASEAEVLSSALELLVLRDSSPEMRRKVFEAALEEGEAALRAGDYVTLTSRAEVREHLRSLGKR